MVGGCRVVGSYARHVRGYEGVYANGWGSRVPG